MQKYDFTLPSPLDGILLHEISLGNEIERVIKNGYSKAKIVVKLKKPMDVNFCKAQKHVLVYKNTDPHHEIEQGVAAKECVIAGPIE